MGDNDSESPVTTASEPITTPAASDAAVLKTHVDQEAEETEKTAEEMTPSPEAAPPTQEDKQDEKKEKPDAVVGKKKLPYVYDPDMITLRFLFANRDGLSVTVKCNPADTVGEVKGALISVWPEELPSCSGGDSLRLICMGKGILMPDSRTLQDFEVPVFKTHPTPVNVAVRPARVAVESKKPFGASSNSNSALGNRRSNSQNVTSQGCACVIL